VRTDSFSQFVFTRTTHRWRLRTAGNALAAVVVVLSGCSVGDRLGPNRVDADGYTPLMRAAESGNVSEIRRLRKAGADPNYQGRLVTHYSILFPFTSQEWVNVPRDSLTPLIVAARSGRADSISALLAAGANPDIEPRLGVPHRTALWYASEAGHLEAARALAEGGVNRESLASHTALRTAIENGHVELAQMLARAVVGIRVANFREGPTTPTDWSSPVTLAARHGYADLLKELITAGVNVRGNAGGTALRAAAENGHGEAARILLDAGTDPNGEGQPVGVTPLGLAAARGDAVIVEELLQHGADPNATQSREGAPPLILAARGGHVDAVRLLLARGASVEARDRSGLTAAARAAEGGHDAVVALLTAAGARPADTRSKELLRAVQKAALADVRELLKAGVDPNLKEDRDGRTLLMLASLEGRLEIVSELLRSRADPNLTDAAGQNALTLAAIRGHDDVVRALLAAGAQVTDDGRGNALIGALAGNNMKVIELIVPHASPAARSSALVYAVEKGRDQAVATLGHDLDPALLSAPLISAARAGQPHAVSTLLELGAPAEAADTRGITALMWSAYGGNAETTRALLAAGAEPDKRAPDHQVGDGRLPRSTGWTALLWAASLDHAEVVRVLLEAKADVSVTDSRKNTALSCAAENGSIESVALLQQAGAKGNVDDARVRTTAILRAAQRGNVERVQQLLQMGVSARTANEYGVTPLHEAARTGRTKVVSVLLEAGADPNARTRAGETPMWYVEQGSNPEILDALRQAGGRSEGPGATTR
jgi:ankyrin repeat protein